MPSPPILHRQYPSPRQYQDESGEGFEIDASTQVVNVNQQLFHNSNTTPMRVPSPHESPSDEVMVDDGYFEDEDFVMMPQQQQQQQSQYQIQQQQSRQQPSEMQARQYQQQQQLQMKQQSNTTQQLQQHPQRQTTPIINEKHQSQQPDWHQLQRNRYQKKFATRYQNAAQSSSSITSSSPNNKNYSSSTQIQPDFRSSPSKQPNVSNFSPIEDLVHRSDQIQRKRMPGGVVAAAVEQKEHHEDGEENNSLASSVLDRARCFGVVHHGSSANKQRYGTTNTNNIGEQVRSKSVPKERGSQRWSSSNNSNYATVKFHDDSMTGTGERGHGQDYPYADDDTITESVASRKKEWEKFHSGLGCGGPQNKQTTTRNNNIASPENEVFGMWSERANRLAQQRLSEQRNEQRRQRTEQRKSIEQNWRRSAAKSMSPGRRRSDIRDEDNQYDYVPVYSESLENEYHCNPTDSSHMSIEERRRMLWDGNERLKTVLPRNSTFDDSNHVPSPENTSPGTASGSQGSSFFKSKFVRAAAVATQQRSDFEVVDEHPAHRSSPKSHMHKGGAVSSHYTDSTAGTTPVGSHGSSRLTQSTNVSRSRTEDYQRGPSPEHTDQLRPRGRLAQVPPNAGSGERSKSAGSANRVSVMPSIAETPRSSVTDLIARINAVSRSNPEEALKAIDSILKAESSAKPCNGNTPHQQRDEPTQSPFSPSRKAAAQEPRLLRKDFSQSVQEPKQEDDEEDESFLSSDESTVSSMTNPTYASIPVHKRTAANSNQNHGGNKQPQYSPPILEEFEVETSKTPKRSTLSRATPNNVAPRSTSNNVNPQSNSYANRQQYEKDDVIVTKPSSDFSEETGKRRFVEANIGGLNYRLSKTKSEEQTVRSNPSKVQQEQQSIPKTKQHVTANTNQLDDSAWVPVPNNDYFQNNSQMNKSKSWDEPKRQGPVSKPPKEPQTIHHKQERRESKYLSDTELSHGQAAGLPSVVSDAFSGIDIDFDDGTASNAVIQHPTIVSSQSADLEPKKTVRQRRQELENLAKSWNEPSPGNEAEEVVTTIKHSTSLDSQARSNNADINTYDWANSPDEDNKIKEPKLRLKSSKKLAQKFASLVKAFESD